MPDTAPVPRLSAISRRIDAPDDLLTWTAPHAPLTWLRRGDGFVGSAGAALVLEEHGIGRAARLAARWREVTAAARVDDEVGVAGSGLIAFGTLVFDDRSASSSTLVVPRVVIGRRGGVSWMTTVTVGEEDMPHGEETPFGPHWSAALGAGALDPAQYQDAVRAGLAAIDQRVVDKVVLARDLTGTTSSRIDLRRLVRELSTGYPDCWTYAVDGMIGASPETLVTVSGGDVTARVLAGTAARGPDADADNLAAGALASSDKDQDEHGYAVRSLVAALSPYTSALAASDEPFLLKLPNVWHLATDVEGSLSGAASSLDLVGALHPTAAVAGTPTPMALDEIARIEPFDRGRYAGPVGWINAAGDGEWAIGLRCVQVTNAGDDEVRLTAHAGAGIVTGSDPEREMLETRVKFRPIVEAVA